MMAICIAALSTAAAAECVGFADAPRRWLRASDVAFDGTVIKLEQIAADGTRTNVDEASYPRAFTPDDDRLVRQYAATMQVHRYWKWKGAASKETVVYFAPSWDGPSFKIGRRSVVFATEHPDRWLVDHYRQSSVGSGHAWVPPCSGLLWDAKEALKQLGRASKS